MNKNRTRILLLVLVLLLASLACQSVIPDSSTAQATQPPVVVTVVVTPQTPVSYTPNTTSNLDLLSNEEAVLVDLYARINPSVVNISIYDEQDGVALATSQGSGFLYDSLGNIVTNAHVVHGAKQIEVTFADGTIRPAELLGEDLNSDLAVVHVEDFPAGLQGLPLGSMENLAVGQSVVAIGNPFGLQGTLTRGIISALGRTIPALTVFSIPQAIQTDAAINPGNSGGPLLNLKGEVIGVNAQIETSGLSNSNSGVGFAIPVSIVRLVVPDLIEKGKFEWSWLGVRGGSLTYELVQAMNLPFEKGAYLWQVVDGGPAAKAGLRGYSKTVTYEGRSVDIGGDIVTAMDGQPVGSFDDMLLYIALQARPGQEVTLTIFRDGQYKEVQLKLEARPASVP